MCVMLRPTHTNKKNPTPKQTTRHIVSTMSDKAGPCQPTPQLLHSTARSLTSAKHAPSNGVQRLQPMVQQRLIVHFGQHVTDVHTTRQLHLPRLVVSVLGEARHGPDTRTALDGRVHCIAHCTRYT